MSAEVEPLYRGHCDECGATAMYGMEFGARDWATRHDEEHHAADRVSERRHVAVFAIPGRGTSYTATYGGHEVQVYVTEKRQYIRVWVDGIEWKGPR